MTSKDASGKAATRLRTLLSLGGGSLLLLAVCLVARSFWGPGSAVAQAPTRQTTSPRTAAPQVNRAPAGNRAATPAGPAAPAAQPAQRQVAAVVNGQQISQDDLAQECVRRYGNEVLESIVNKHLIWQACQQRSITITEQDVENEIDEMARKFGLSKDRWLVMLERERSISPDRYRREIVWPTLALRRLAHEQIEVSEEELKKAFESEYGPKVKVRMISVGSLRKAEDVHRRAVADPENFGELAKAESEDSMTASARGIVPPIRKHVGYEELERAAFSLQEGQISEIIPVADQYLILKCEKHLPETYVSSTNLERIQTQLRDQIRDNKLRLGAAELFQKLQSEAQVVNVLNDPQLRQQTPGIAATINGRSVSLQQLSDECVLRYGKEVLDGEINRLVLQQELQRKGKAVTDAGISTEIQRAADSYGYQKADGTPDVDAWLKAVTENDHVTIDLYIHDAVWPSVALKELVDGTIEVTQDDLQKGFESNYGERVEALAIVLSNQRQANEVWEMARNNPTDQFFGELANQYSIEPVSRANFGKVPPIRRHGGQPIVEEEAFRLKPGDLSAILNVGDKFIIIRCQGRTQPVVQDFQAVKGELFKDIHEKKLRLAMADEFDRLKEAAQIDNFLVGSSQAGRNRSATQPRPTTVPAPTRR